MVYRSLNVEKENKENKEKEKEKLSASSSFALSSGAAPTNGLPTLADNENGTFSLYFALCLHLVCSIDTFFGSSMSRLFELTRKV